MLVRVCSSATCKPYAVPRCSGNPTAGRPPRPRSDSRGKDRLEGAPAPPRGPARSSTPRRRGAGGLAVGRTASSSGGDAHPRMRLSGRSAPAPTAAVDLILSPASRPPAASTRRTAPPPLSADPRQLPPPVLSPMSAGAAQTGGCSHHLFGAKECLDLLHKPLDWPGTV